MNRETLEKVYAIETKPVNLFSVAMVHGKRRAQNLKASPIMLLKTHIEKMSHFGLAIMSMKTSELNGSSHYVYENNGVIKN